MFGPKDHLKSECPLKKAENTAPIQLTHVMPLLGENPDHHWERILDLLAKEPHFIPSDKHIVMHRGYQKLGQKAEGGKHMIWLKRKSKYWMSKNMRGCSISGTGTLKVSFVTIILISSCFELAESSYHIHLIALLLLILVFFCPPSFLYVVPISSIFTILIFLAFIST